MEPNAGQVTARSHSLPRGGDLNADCGWGTVVNCLPQGEITR
jgi:hypothetical protein